MDHTDRQRVAAIQDLAQIADGVGRVAERGVKLRRIDLDETIVRLAAPPSIAATQLEALTGQNLTTEVEVLDR